MDAPTSTTHELARIADALERAEAQIASLEDELAHADRLATLGTLVGAVAHEFNNILTPVMSFAQLAMASPEDAALTRKALERAYAGAERASQVASTMLGFARQRQEPPACLVEPVLLTAEETARLDAHQPPIEVDYGLEEGLCAGITPLALQQVLVNLLLNARKAIASREGRIRVRARRSTWNGGAGITIEVEDNGCGMDAELLGRLFVPFTTGATPSGPSGTGLGLSICKRLIEHVNGRIDVSSRVGAGTTFRIDLPEGDPALLRPPHRSTNVA